LNYLQPVPDFQQAMATSRLLIPALFFSSLACAQHAITITSLKECLPDRYELTDVFVQTSEEVGIVLKGPFNTPRVAMIEPDIRTGILNAARKNCPANEGGRPLAIKVNELSVYEVSATSEHALAVLNIDVLEQQDGQWVHLFNSGGTLRSGGLDVTSHHGWNIARRLEEDLRPLHTGEAAVRAHFPALAGEHLSRRTEVNDLWLPVHQRDLPYGVFKSFNDLRMARAVAIDEGQDIHKQARRLRKESWGYSDGSHLYTWHGRDPIRLEYQDGNLTGMLHFAEHDNGAVFAGSVMFGLVGGIVANELSKKQHSVPVMLDMMTGDLVRSHDADLLPPTPPDVTHIIYLSRHGKNDAPLQVLDGGRALVSLDRDTYCELEFYSGYPAKTLVLAGSSPETIELTLPLHQSGAMVHLVQLDGNGTPVLKPVNRQMNERLLYSLKEDRRRTQAFEPHLE
jgi:hypothetical protein